MKTIFLLLGAALLVPAAVAAQSFTVASQVVSSSAAAPVAPPTPSQPAASAGSLTYFGTVRSHDCQHEQFARLRQAFATVRPTVVFFENPDMGFDSTEATTIGGWGEGAYVRFLAQQQQVPTQRLDDPEAEYAYLRTQLDPERLKLFCLLRETQRFRARTGASKVLAKKAMLAFIAHSDVFLPGTGGTIRNEAELEAAYQKYCPAGPKWWDAPAAWFNPAATGTSLSNPAIEGFKGAVQAFREQALYGRLAAQAQAGQRVLVVLSRDYLPLVPKRYLARQ